MEVFTRRLLSVTSPLNTVIASRYPPILNFNIGRWVCEFTLSIRSGALLSLELSTHLQLQPARVLLVEECAHVEHRQCLRVDIWGVRHNWSFSHGSSCLDSDSPHRNLYHTCPYNLLTLVAWIRFNMAACRIRQDKNWFITSTYKSHFWQFSGEIPFGGKRGDSCGRV